MNLFYTATAFPPSIGGAQIHLLKVASSLALHHKVQAACHWNTNRNDWLLGTTLRQSVDPIDYVIDGVSVHRLGFSNITKLKMAPYVGMYYLLMERAIPEIASYISVELDGYAKKADLIHNVRIGREPLSYASLQLARKFDLPFVFTPVHHPRWVGWPYNEYIKIYKSADLLFALTENEKLTLTSIGVSPERISVTGIGPILAAIPFPEQFMREYQINDPYILFIGQHYEYKGYRQLLEATSIVWERFPETTFVFIGPLINRSQRIFKLFPDNRIRVLGHVDLQTKTNALAACTCLCVPSTQESFGGVYTEAWALSKPVIGCNIPAVSEVVSNEIDGLLINQDSRQIADAICFLLQNRIIAEKMGMMGYKKVQEKYNWDYLASLTEQAYLNVI